MPQKSKEKKLSSQERREHQLQQMFSIHQPDNIHQKPVEDSPFELPAKEPRSSLKVENDSARLYFMRDIKKSLFLIACVIALEIAVYFGTINNYFKF